MKSLISTLRFTNNSKKDPWRDYTIRFRIFICGWYKLSIFLIFLLTAIQAFSQNEPSPFRIWHLSNISGEAKLKGNYRTSKTVVGNDEYSQQYKYIYGILQLNTKSYFVHPNFMLLDFNVLYNPEARMSSFISAPDYSENITREGIDASALFFSKKRVHLIGTYTLNNSIQNLENIASVKSKNKQYGGKLLFTNRILPATIGYTKVHFEQQYVGTDNRFEFDQRIIQADLNKSFGALDYNSFQFLHSENTSIETSPSSHPFPFRNDFSSDLFELNNDVSFDHDRKYTFSSSISSSTEKGIPYYKRLFAHEIINIKLPRHLLFSSNYNLSKTNIGSIDVYNQNLHNFISHQLFESLNSKLIYDYNNSAQARYEENRNKYGIELNYNKKLPVGKLKLMYSYYREYEKVKTAPTTLATVREEYILDDNQIIFLTKQNVNISTVVVKDVTGLLVYRLNIDYFLIDHNPYLEIIRIPGGLIPNNSPVFIDYTSEYGGNFEYYMNNQSFSADLLLFKDVLNLYYRTFNQDYSMHSPSENLAFNYYKRYIIGTRVDFHIVGAGVEYEYYNSSIIPYTGMKYFISFVKPYKNFSFMLNANMLIFQMSNEAAKRRDIDVSGKIAYAIFKNTKIDFDFMYKNMKGRGIDVNMRTSKLEITTNFHKLLLSLGTDIYNYTDINTSNEYRGLFLQATRPF